MKTKNLLLIFTRNPELGKVKTRLAASIGNKSALDIYKFLLNHTQKITEKVISDRVVYYSEDIKEHDIWNEDLYEKKLQKGKGLGDKMENAFRDGFNAGYKKIVIIGSDLYDLETNDIEEAFEKLNTNDIVLGPAEDGGYYLLGMKTLHPEVFKNKNWGTETVLQETLDNIHQKKVKLLNLKNDIDTYEDLKKNPFLVDLFLKQTI